MYLNYHDHFSNEVYQASACYVIWKHLQNEPASDEVLLKVLNYTPLSWIFIRHSMMVTLIMTLGRIFDTDGDTVSIDDFIKSCITDIHLFSKESLRERKMKSHNASEWIDEYISEAYEPIAEDFQRLKSPIKKFRDIYHKYYRPLRHNIFAHSSNEYHSQTGDLWQATGEANMEDMLSFLKDLNITVREAYQNGKKPDLKNRKFDEAWFAKDIKELLDRVKNA